MTTSASLLDQVAIVLVRPKIPENIGAAARIAWNMGIKRLILVRKTLPEREEMAKMATHKAAHLIDTIEVYSDLREALADFSVVVGTTARRGRHRFAVQGPREIAAILLPLLAANRTALIFGPEDTGLTNDDLSFCQFASAIPTADFSSINLAQAVAIHCYEMYYAVVHAQKDMVPSPKLATSFELESMYAAVETAIDTLYQVERTQKENWLENIRHLLNKRALTAREASTVRGVCKKLNQQRKTLIR
jgi:tRNA/rRNA methyltransferase